MYHLWGKRDVHAGFWWGNLNERGHLKAQAQVRK